MAASTSGSSGSVTTTGHQHQWLPPQVSSSGLLLDNTILMDTTESSSSSSATAAAADTNINTDDDRRRLLCRFHLRGQCRDGHWCRFSHDPNRSQPIPESVCWYHLQSHCMFGDNCRFEHLTAGQLLLVANNNSGNGSSHHQSTPLVPPPPPSSVTTITSTNSTVAAAANIVADDHTYADPLAPGLSPDQSLQTLIANNRHKVATGATVTTTTTVIGANSGQQQPQPHNQKPHLVPFNTNSRTINSSTMSSSSSTTTTTSTSSSSSSSHKPNNNESSSIKPPFILPLFKPSMSSTATTTTTIPSILSTANQKQQQQRLRPILTSNPSLKTDSRQSSSDSGIGCGSPTNTTAAAATAASATTKSYAQIASAAQSAAAAQSSSTLLVDNNNHQISTTMMTTTNTTTQQQPDCYNNYSYNTGTTNTTTAPVMMSMMDTIIGSSSDMDNDNKVRPTISAAPPPVAAPKYKTLCPYAMHAIGGICPYPLGQCQYTHGEECDYCGQYCLHPTDPGQRDRHRDECIREHEREMELSFAVQRSLDKACGICMDIVMEKEPITERRFGILEKCAHIFCLSCIRKWRQTKQFDNRTIRSCPECRVSSDFVIPSKYWYDDQSDKQQLILSYKKALSTKPCKYFKQGQGECPFAGACFYLHAYPDGRKAEMPPPRQRRRQNQEGELETLRDMLLWNYLEVRDNNHWLLTLDLEDVFDIQEMGLLSSYETDDDDDSDLSDYADGLIS